MLSQHPSYPFYINTTADEFELNRAKGRRIRASLIGLSILESTTQSSSNSTESPQETTTTPNNGSKTSNKTSNLRPGSTPRWADIALRPGDHPVPPRRKAPPKIVSPTAESLGVVLVRTLFQPGYAPPASPLPPRGLINRGNICYMLLILQILVHTTPFRGIMKAATRAQGSLGDLKTPLLDSYLLFLDSYAEKGGPLDPELFYHSISRLKHFSHLRWGQQEDAEEFLGYFLDALHEELAASLRGVTLEERKRLLSEVRNPGLRSEIEVALDAFHESDMQSTSTVDKPSTKLALLEWQEVGRKKVATREVSVQLTPVTQLFGGQFRSELELPRLRDSRLVTLDPFQHIQLDISSSHVNLVEQALKLFVAPEMIAYGLSEARKQTLIDRLPRVLILQLKRFLYVSSCIEKIRKPVSYPHEMEIPEECVSQILKNKPREYILSGVVYHHGASTDVGHYTVDVRIGAEWAHIDDDKVEKISKDSVVACGEESKSAYLLFYERKRLK